MERHGPDIGKGNGCKPAPSVPPVELDISTREDTSSKEELLEASPPLRQKVSRRKKFGKKKTKRTQEGASIPERCQADKEEKEESEDGEDLLSLMDFLRTTSPTSARRRDQDSAPTRAARSNSTTHAGKKIFSVFGRSKSEAMNGQHLEAFPYRGKWRRKERAKVNKAAATRERSNTMITPSLSSPSLGEVITRGRSTSSADGMSYDIAKLCLSDSRLTAVHKDFPESPPAGEVLSPTVVRSHISKEAFDRANSSNNNDNTINLREESLARVFHSAPILTGLSPRKRKKPKKTLSRTKQKHNKQQRDKENNPNSPPRKVDSKVQLLKGLRLREEKGGGAVEYPADELSLLEFVYLLEQEIIAEEELEETCKDHEELQRQRQQLRDRGIWERSPSANSLTTTRQYDDNGYGGDDGTEEENAVHSLEECTTVGQAPVAICMDSMLLVSTPLQRV
ncbi:hypothetical protein QOT17_012221 [Balamuthia mandrillaris]